MNQRTPYFYGYNIVAAGFITQAVCIGAMFTYGVFFKELETTFGWSRALVSGASSLAFLVMGVGAAVAGAFNDRIGPRIILTISSTAMGAGYLLMSRLQTSWQLYLFYGVLVGIGFATHDVITLSTVARWFHRRRGTMSGLVKVGTGAGQLLVPLAVTGLIAAVGWRNAYLVIGAVTMAGLIAVAQIMRRDPEAMGLRPDNAPPATASGRDADDESLSPGQAFGTRSFWYLCLAQFAVFSCIFTIIVHIVPHGRDLGLAPAVAAGVLSTIGGVSMAGRIIMGMINDRIGGKRSLLITFAIIITGLLLLQVADRTWLLFTFAAIYGFAHGALFTLISPTVAELFGTAFHGSLFGLILFAGTLGASIGPVLVGHLFDLTGSYRIGFAGMAAMAVAGLLLVAFLRPERGRPHG